MSGARDEFRKGWKYLLGAFIGIGGGFASLYFYSAGLFLKPLSQEFGWSRTEASLSAMAFMIGNVIALPVAGRLVDRYGEVRVALMSGLGLALAFVLLGTVTSGLLSFLCLVLFLTMVSAGTNSVSYNRVVVRHFVRNRGLALGIALLGTALGATVLPAVLVPFIAENGWRLAYLVLGVIAVVLTVCGALLLREPASSQVGRRETGGLPWRVICSHPAFLSISALIFLSSTAVLGTTLHLVPLLTDRGMDAVHAGSIASALGLAVIGGRVFAGYLLDRWDAGWIAFLLLSLAGVGALLLWTGQPLLVLPATILLGFGLGTETDLLAYLLGRRFPIRSFSSVYGTIFAVHALGSGIGGIAAGKLFDLTGNYDVWLLLACAGLVAAGLIALCTERGFVAAPESLHASDLPA